MSASKPPALAVAFIALGANLGDAKTTVRNAIVDLAHLSATQLLAASHLYVSAPHEASGPDFINAVAKVRTGLSAHDLLQALQTLEQAAGRQRPWPNAPRTLDLDLLLYGDQVIDTGELTVPHPRMNERAFVLRPLAEIAPERVPLQRLQAVRAQHCERSGSEPPDVRANLASYTSTHHS